MKLKVNFDRKAILEFLAQHAEKLAFATVAVVFLGLVYSAIGRERFSKTPRDLVEAADAARRNIDPTGNNRELTGIKTNDWLGIIEGNEGKVDEAHYRASVVWDPAIFAEKRKRGEPGLFPVENLRATAGMGRFGEAGRFGMGRGRTPMDIGGRTDSRLPDEELEPLGRRYVVLVGLVNIDKYETAFRECFDNVVREYSQDVPDFIYFELQRAEVSDPGRPEDLRWQSPYPPGHLFSEIDKWTSTGVAAQELVETTYIDPRGRLVFPLPQRMDREWGKEIAHPPEIPLLDYAEHGMMDQGDREEDEVEGSDELELFGNRGGPGGVSARRDWGGVGRMGPGMDPGDEMGMSPRRRARAPRMRAPRTGRPALSPRGGFEGGIDGGFSRGRGGMRPGMGAFRQEEPSPYYLFRFIDFNVQPGRHYRYRVRLWLTNPNYDVEPRYLTRDLQQLVRADEGRPKKEKKWKKYVTTDWSETSEAVAVPRDDRLLVVSIKDTPRPTVLEPRAKIMAVHWDLESGEEVFDEFDVSRGTLANFLDQKIPENEQEADFLGHRGGPGIGPELGLGLDEEGFGRPARRPKRPRPRRGQPNEEEETVDYRTEVLVLDMWGGGRLPGRNRDLTEPGEMLLLDPDGNLLHRSDIDDLKDYNDHKNPAEGEDRWRRQIPGGRRMGPPDGGLDDEGFLMQPGGERRGGRARRPR